MYKLAVLTTFHAARITLFSGIFVYFLPRHRAEPSGYSHGDSLYCIKRGLGQFPTNSAQDHDATNSQHVVQCGSDEISGVRVPADALLSSFGSMIDRQFSCNGVTHTFQSAHVGAGGQARALQRGSTDYSP